MDVTQSYYTDATLREYDTLYGTSFIGAPPSNFSPIAVNARTAPTDLFSVTLRAEIDSQYLELRTISANGSYSARPVQRRPPGGASARLSPESPPFNDPASLDQYINASGSAHTQDNAVGATYSIYYDMLRSRLLQQRITGFYNSQCCGLALDTRPSTSAAQPPASSTASPRITASSCRSRSPAWATSRRSTARCPALPAERSAQDAGFDPVTGAAGFAGSHLLDLLANDDADIVAWHRPGGSPDVPRSRDGVAGGPSARSRAAFGRALPPFARPPCTIAPALRTSANRGKRPHRHSPPTSAPRTICSARCTTRTLKLA